MSETSQRQDAMSSKNLQTSQHALQVLEHLSQQQGTGEITLFFRPDRATLPTSGSTIRPANQFRRLSFADEPGAENSIRHDRQRIGDRQHER